jgi:hypothetical protein
MATRDVLEKIKGTTYGNTLERKKQWRKNLLESGEERAARETQISIAGYVHALRDAGIITESERRTLFIYYGTV